MLKSYNEWAGEQKVENQEDWANKAIAASDMALKGLLAIKPFLTEDKEAWMAVMKAAAAVQGFQGKIAPFHASQPFQR